MNSEWEMPRRADRCAACERSFEVGQNIRAVLVVRPPSAAEGPQGYERRDYCAACEPAADPPPLASWITRRPEPPAPKRPVLNTATAFQLFEQLDAPESAEQAQLRFVLALLLWRKKVLNLEDTLRIEAGEVWRFSLRGQDRTYDVARADIDEAQMETLGRQVEQLITGETVEPEETPAETPSEQGDG